MIPITEKIGFKLLLSTISRDVVDPYCSEVGLPGDGTETGEFGTIERNPIIIFRMLVFERFKQPWIVFFILFAKAAQSFCFILIINRIGCRGWEDALYLSAANSSFSNLVGEIFFQALVAQSARGTVATPLCEDAIVAGECFVVHDLEYSQFFR